MEHDIGRKRRRLVSAAAAAGVTAMLGVSLAFAQSATPTPATPAAGASSSTQTDTASSMLDRIDAEIAAVKADRDAVTSGADLSVVDQLLTQAGAFRDKVSTASAGTNDSTTRNYALAAIASTHAAEDLIRAQLSAYGLPSQKDMVGRELSDAHDEIAAITTAAASSTDADVTSAVSTAQSLYAKAFDLYNAGTYAQANGTARAAVTVGRIASILTSTGDGGTGKGGFGGDDGGGMHHGGRDLHENRDNGAADHDQSGTQSGDSNQNGADASSTPVTVPDPTF